MTIAIGLFGGHEMKRLMLFALLAPLACSASSGLEGEGSVGAVEEPLLAYSDTLWPMKDGVATVSVCWLPLDASDQTFGASDLKPDLVKAVAEREAWIQRAVEREWNGKTVMRFVGWKPCGADPVDVQLHPTSSATTTTCLAGNTPAAGQWCVQAFGTKGKGRQVHMNVLFGDEAIYQAAVYEKYGTKEKTKSVASLVVPALCTDEIVAMLNDPSSSSKDAAFRAVWEDCVAQQGLHELGHVAGFAHEQNRRDDATKRAACLKAIGADDTGAYDPALEGDLPLGAFDSESVMSYCRTNKSATLTAEDVAQTNAVYAKLAKKEETDAPTAPAVSSDAAEGTDFEESPSSTKSAPKTHTVEVPAAGCM